MSLLPYDPELDPFNPANDALALANAVLFDTQRELARLQERISSLCAAIEHGDEKHKAWLKKAIDDHMAGRPVERP